MSKKILSIITSLMAAFYLLAPAVVWAHAPIVADAKGSVCEGVGLTGAGNNTCQDTGGLSVDGIIKVAINIFSIVVGVAAVLMIMIGGFKYIISQGDSGNVNSAKNTILYAVIGLVVVLLAQVIVKFVLNKAQPCPAGQAPDASGVCVATP